MLVVLVFVDLVCLGYVCVFIMTEIKAKLTIGDREYSITRTSTGDTLQLVTLLDEMRTETTDILASSISDAKTNKNKQESGTSEYYSILQYRR